MSLQGTVLSSPSVLLDLVILEAIPVVVVVVVAPGNVVVVSAMISSLYGRVLGVVGQVVVDVDGRGWPD